MGLGKGVEGSGRTHLSAPERPAALPATAADATTSGATGAAPCPAADGGEAVVRAIVWKEFREQGLIGLTLVVLGGGVLVAVAVLADPPQIGATPGDVFRALGPGPLATLLLAVTAGTVCGGALFAAEREAGTHGFLESLPARRSQLWTGKVLAGGLLVAAQAGAVIATGFGLGLLASAGWALAVGVYSFLAFCWGVLGSTLARTTLGSVGVAIPAATVAAVPTPSAKGPPLTRVNPLAKPPKNVGGPSPTSPQNSGTPKAKPTADPLHI